MRFVDVSQVRAQINLGVCADDGTRLSVDLYSPGLPGQYPALVTRTPYDNNRTVAPKGPHDRRRSPSELYRMLAAHGYLVVACDVRGRGDSEGDFVPFRSEVQDGVATLRWVRQHPVCSGEVGLFGSGYAAFCSWAAAVGDGAANALVSTSPFGPGMIAPGGALRLDWLYWMHLVAGRTVQPPELIPWHDIWRHQPVRTMDEPLGRADIWWRDWVDHPEEIEEPLRSVLAGVQSLDVAGLHLTGWWDGLAASSRAYWNAASHSPGGHRQHLVVGPWDTRITRRPEQIVGGFDFGPTSPLDPTELMLDFFGSSMGRDLSAAPQAAARPRARLFKTGANEWADVDSWPVPVERRSLWLSSGGRANTRRGDGELTTDPTGGATDSYHHDHNNPVWCQPDALLPGPGVLRLDEGHLTGRDDVLVYTAPAASTPWTLAGRARLELWAQSDSIDTDWVVTISDVFPNEASTLHLSHAVVRAGTSPDFAPHKAVRYVLDLGEAFHEFQPGHRLRLCVTSSLFPRYAQTVGPEGGYVDGPTNQLAQQHVLHNAQHPSRLLVPVWLKKEPN